jgi:GTP-binding protein
MYQQIHQQTLLAVEEADIVLFVFDAVEGMTPTDLQFLKRLRAKKIVWLLANKVDSHKRFETLSTYEYLQLPSFPVSATSGKGIGDMLEALSEALPKSENTIREQPIIALIGRPNVGKSTLLNALTQTDRAVVSPVAGTTRDIVTGSLKIDDKEFLLADTAGVRRRGRIEVGPESFSVKRTLAAISQANAVLVLLDASEGTTRGDLHLIYFAKALEKPILLVLNKIDLVPAKQVPFYRYLNKFPNVAISAKDGENIEEILDWVRENVPSTRVQTTK